jgi:hypothetical protein
MKRLVLASTAILFLAGPSCGSNSETTEWCPDACTIWSDCTGWEYDACLSECGAEGDWDASYLSCLRAQSCDNLDACE